MRSNIRVILLCGLLTLSFVQAETVFEPIARFTVLRDRLFVDESHNKLPVTGNGELGGRWVLHRQRAFWGLVQVESPSMISVDNDKIGRIDASGNARFIINPDFLVGGYVGLEGLVSYPADAPLKALESFQAIEEQLVKVHAGLDLTLLPLLSKMPWPLQITIGGHMTWDSEESSKNSIVSDMLIPHDIGGATLKIAADYTQTSKIFGTAYYRYHDSEIKHRGDIQHNGGVGGGLDYHWRFATLTAEGWWDYHSGFYVRFGVKVDGLGAQNFSDRSLQSYLKRDIPKHVAPLVFLGDLQEEEKEEEEQRGRSRTRELQQAIEGPRMQKTDPQVYSFQWPKKLNELLEKYCDLDSTHNLEHLIRSSGDRGRYAALSFLQENEDIEESDERLGKLTRLLKSADHKALEKASRRLQEYNQDNQGSQNITFKKLLKYLEAEAQALEETSQAVRGSSPRSKSRSRVEERSQSGRRADSRVRRSKSGVREEKNPQEAKPIRGRSSRSNSRGVEGRKSGRRADSRAPRSKSGVREEKNPQEAKPIRGRSSHSELRGVEGGKPARRSDSRVRRSKSGVREERDERGTRVPTEAAKILPEAVEEDILEKLSAAKAALIQYAYFAGSETHWKAQQKRLRAIINGRELFKAVELKLIKLLPEEESGALLIELLASLQKWPIEVDISLVECLATDANKVKLLGKLLENNAFEEQCHGSHFSILDKTIGQLRGVSPEEQQENYYNNERESDLVLLISQGLDSKAQGDLLIRLLKGGFTDKENVLNGCIQELVKQNACPDKISLVKELLPAENKSTLLRNLFKTKIFEIKAIPTQYLEIAVTKCKLSDVLLIIQDSSSLADQEKEKSLIIEIDHVLRASQSTSEELRLESCSPYTRALTNVDNLLTEEVTRTRQLECVAPSAILDHTVELIRQSKCGKVLSREEQSKWEQRWSKHLYDKHTHRYVSLSNKLGDLLNLYKAQKNNEEAFSGNYILGRTDKRLIENLYKKYNKILSNSLMSNGKLDASLEQPVTFNDSVEERGRDKVKNPKIAQRPGTPYASARDLDDRDTENESRGEKEAVTQPSDGENSTKEQRSRSRSRHGHRQAGVRSPSTTTQKRHKNNTKAPDKNNRHNPRHAASTSGSASQATLIAWSDVAKAIEKLDSQQGAQSVSPLSWKQAEEELVAIKPFLQGEISDKLTSRGLIKKIQSNLSLLSADPAVVERFRNIEHAYYLDTLEGYLQQKKEALRLLCEELRKEGISSNAKTSTIMKKLLNYMRRKEIKEENWPELLQHAKLVWDTLPSRDQSDAKSTKSSKSSNRNNQNNHGFFGNLFQRK